MNKRHVLSKFILSTAAIFALAACGGGDDSKALAAGKVGTLGDGVNQAEYDALQCGMNRDQVAAIVADQPTALVASGTQLAWALQFDSNEIRAVVAFNLTTDLLTYKGYGPIGAGPTSYVTC
jgi:hypothetical protein